jgi:hypothetical protein
MFPSVRQGQMLDRWLREATLLQIVEVGSDFAPAAETIEQAPRPALLAVEKVAECAEPESTSAVPNHPPTAALAPVSPRDELRALLGADGNWKPCRIAESAVEPEVPARVSIFDNTDTPMAIEVYSARVVGVDHQGRRASLWRDAAGKIKYQCESEPVENAVMCKWQRRAMAELDHRNEQRQWLLDTHWAPPAKWRWWTRLCIRLGLA